MQRLGHSVLLLVIVLLSNKSGGNASESLYHANNNERYDNTTHFAKSPRNKSVQTLKEAFRENSSRNNLQEETNSTGTGREELDKKEDDEFARRKITENGKSQVRANKTAMKAIFVTPITYKNAIYFTTEPCDNTTKCTTKKNNFWLCCPSYHRLSTKEWKCLVDRNVTFPFAHKMDKGIYALSNILYLPFLPSCRIPELKYTMYNSVTPLGGNAYTFDDDATVHFPGNFYLPSNDYCLAAVNQIGFHLVFCSKKYDTSTGVMYVLAAIIVSLIFLLITFVIYSILREFQNMHGYTLRAYIASLFILNTIYAVYVQLGTFGTFTHSVCASLGFIFNFAMYSTFLWLNVTCFDIWWTFRRILPIHKTRKRKRRVNKKFVIYALYAWGGSFVVTILTIIMDFTPNIPDYLIKPQFCKSIAWFGTEKAKIVYFYVPVGIIMICNICLFVLTALKIFCDKKRINRQMRNSESRRHDDRNKERLWMYLKLFIIMGMNWIQINFTIEMGTFIMTPKSFNVWYIAELITPLQNVVIFIIFVCKKKVIQLLMQRFGWSSDSLFCWFRVKRAENSILQNTTTRANEAHEMQELVLTCSRTLP